MTHKAKLLVVEDQPNERRAMARLLKMEGYDAHTAQNADEALGRIGEPVDLVITDLKMPDSSGVELLRRWKAERPATPFVMVTAYAEVDSAVAAMKLGAKDYLTKPVKPDELLGLVARIVAEQALAPAAPETLAGSAATVNHCPAAAGAASPGEASPGEAAPISAAKEATRLEDLEKDAVLRVLEREGGNRTHAARLLGISIRTLQRKLKAWGLTARDEAPTEQSDGDPSAARHS